MEDVDDGDTQDSDKQGADGTQEEEFPARASGDCFRVCRLNCLQQWVGSRVYWMFRAALQGEV